MALLQSSVFSQLLGTIDRSYFGRLVRETKAEKAGKGESVFNRGQLLTIGSR
jgi:hypothetical protein